MSKTIKMKRESDGKEVDVHPNELSNYAVGGFVPVDEKIAKKLAAGEMPPAPSAAPTEKEYKDMTVDELKAAAEAKSIDLEGAKKKADILDKLEGKVDVDFASDEAGEFYAENELTLEDLDGVDGTGENGAYTVEDLEAVLTAKNGDFE